MEVFKQVPTTLNLLLLVFGGGLFLYKRGKRKAGRLLLTLAGLVFFLSSTSILPRYLAGQMESLYSPFRSLPLSEPTDSVLVLVLGAGYSLDEGWPATSQLSTTTLARLAEALRICRQIPSSTLVTSGYSSVGLESQASVVFRAAVELGIDSTRIEMLTTPSSTQEEAAAFVKYFGTDNELIIVTDALHMPRAMKIFRSFGLNPQPAPTNYIVRESRISIMNWLPAVKNMRVMDRILHEFLGNIKFRITAK